MRKRLLTSMLMLIIFLGLATAAVLLQRENIIAYKSLPYRYRDSLYLPSSQYVEAVALGYDQFASDYLWLRMIQSFAAGWSRPENATQMMGYFDVITDLDPKFADVYSFAIMAVGEESKRGDLVQEIIKKSFRKLPANYKVPYEGAFYAFWNLKNADLARYYVRMAKLDPDCPEHVKRWEGYFDLNQGRYRAAVEKYLGDYMRAVAKGNVQVYPILETNLVRAVNEWFKSEILQRAEQWKKDYGRYPSVEEMQAAGLFKGVELPDWRYVTGLLNFMMETPVSQSEPITEDIVQKVTTEAIRTWDDLPVGPHADYGPQFAGYVIWVNRPEEQEDLVLSRLEAMQRTQVLAGAIAFDGNKWGEEHDGQMPQSLDEFMPQLKGTTDPFGGAWTWDPKTGRAGCTTYPHISDMAIPQQ